MRTLTLAAMILALGLAVGCGRKGDPVPPSDTPPAERAADPAAAGGG